MGTALSKGAFVRVKAGSEFRPGQDGMVIDPGDCTVAGLVFAFDRYGRHQSALGAVTTGLVEAWSLDELDLESVEGRVVPADAGELNFRRAA